MATAEKLSFLELTSPSVILQITKTAHEDPRKRDDVPSEASTAKRAGVQLTSQAPRLKSGDKSYEQQLIAYMTSVLEMTVQAAMNQTKISEDQTDMSQGSVTASKAAAQNAIQQLQAAQAAAAEAQKKSWWQQLLGQIAAGLMIIIGVLTSNPELAIMGALMLVDSATGLSSKLNDYLESHCGGPVGALFAKIAVAVAMAVVVGGFSGLLRAGVQELAGTATAAAEDAASGAASAASKADSAAADAADGAAQPKSFGDKVLEYGFKNGKGPGGYGQLISTTAQMTMFANPFTDIIQLSVQSSNLSDADKKLVAEVVGTAMAMIVALVTGKFYAGTEGMPSIGSKLISVLGHQGVGAFTFGLKMAAAGTQIGSGACGIEAGEALEKQANAIGALANAEGLEQLCKNLSVQISKMIAQSQANGKSLNDMYAMMNDRWSNFIAPYQMVTQVMA